MDATNTYIDFYDGEPGQGGIRIGEPQLTTVNADSNSIVNVSWQVPLGLHEIWVLINYTLRVGNHIVFIYHMVSDRIQFIGVKQ